MPNPIPTAIRKLIIQARNDGMPILDDVQKAREVWRGSQKTMDLSKLVFIDESSVNTGMTRLYGRAAIGLRIIDYVPVRFSRTSVLSSVR